MDKFRHFLLLLALGQVGCVHTEAPATRSEPASLRSDEIKAPFLWEVAKGKDRSYLFGTVHVGIDADKDLPLSVWKAFGDSPCFVMEADQSQIDARALLAMAKLPPGERLEDKVSPEVWDRIERDLEGEMPEGLIATSKPWFVTILYIQKQMPEGRGMDGVFEERAKALKKRVGYLEDWREAMGAFARATDEKDLEDLVLNGEEARRQMQDLVTAYASGEEKKVTDVLGEIDQSAPGGRAKMDMLLKERNDLWFPRLKEQLAGTRCFVAVGAGHLVGPDSLRVRLEADGYKLRRITSKEALP